MGHVKSRCEVVIKTTDRNEVSPFLLNMYETRCFDYIEYADNKNESKKVVSRSSFVILCFYKTLHEPLLK
jgi:hypothetical protein